MLGDELDAAFVVAPAVTTTVCPPTVTTDGGADAVGEDLDEAEDEEDAPEGPDTTPTPVR